MGYSRQEYWSAIAFSIKQVEKTQNLYNLKQNLLGCITVNGGENNTCLGEGFDGQSYKACKTKCLLMC